MTVLERLKAAGYDPFFRRLDPSVPGRLAA